MPPKAQPSPTAAQPGDQQIDLLTLPTQTLLQLKRQLDSELTTLNTSFTTLRTAASRFTSCLTTLTSGIAPTSTGTPLLVPLTTSLYVPGTLASADTVMVDVGTGFYVEKKVDDAKAFYKRKVAEMEANLRDLEKILNGKSGNLRVVEEVIRGKMVEEQGQGQQGQEQAQGQGQNKGVAASA